MSDKHVTAGAPAPASVNAPAAQPAIKLTKVYRHFGERTVLRKLSFEVQTGQTLAVLGRNGAGKSTLLRILATLLRQHEGEVTLLGQQLPREAWKVRGKIGLLGHEPLLYRDLTGRENLTYHARLHRVDLSQVDRMLDAVGLGKRGDDPVRSLSRGMVQRLTVARAVLHKPEILLLDEPRSNLDPAAGVLVEPLIGRACGATRVMTSHDPQAALEEADVVLALGDGRVTYLGAPDAVTPAMIRELYA